VLNALRADPRRFDPAWLVVAQRNLGGVDATGAMNTETLRAMRTKSGNPSLGADGILNASFLTGLSPGTRFLGGVLRGLGALAARAALAAALPALGGTACHAGFVDIAHDGGAVAITVTAWRWTAPTRAPVDGSRAWP
jgi:hypothetical protein